MPYHVVLFKIIIIASSDLRYIFARMKGGNSIFSTFLFVFTVIILLIKPAIFLRSQSLHSNHPQLSKAYLVKQGIKKTRERLRINNIINNAIPEISISNEFVYFYLFANRQRLEQILLLLSSLLSLFSFFKRKRRSLFEIVPDNHHYLALSVIRI